MMGSGGKREQEGSRRERGRRENNNKGIRKGKDNEEKGRRE